MEASSSNAVPRGFALHVSKRVTQPGRAREQAPPDLCVKSVSSFTSGGHLLTHLRAATIFKRQLFQEVYRCHGRQFANRRSLRASVPRASLSHHVHLSHKLHRRVARAGSPLGLAQSQSPTMDTGDTSGRQHCTPHQPQLKQKSAGRCELVRDTKDLPFSVTDHQRKRDVLLSLEVAHRWAMTRAACSTQCHALHPSKSRPETSHVLGCPPRWC